MDGNRIQRESVKPAAVPTTAPPIGIHLWLGAQRKGPFTDAEVKAMLDAGAVQLDTRFHRPGMAAWRPLRELVSGAGA